MLPIINIMTRADQENIKESTKWSWFSTSWQGAVFDDDGTLEVTLFMEEQEKQPTLPDLAAIKLEFSEVNWCALRAYIDQKFIELNRGQVREE